MTRIWEAIILTLLARSVVLCTCSSHFGPQTRKPSSSDSHRRPTKSPQHLDSVLRSEFQSQIKHRMRDVEENFTQILNKIKQENEQRLAGVMAMCIQQTSAPRTTTAFQAHASGRKTDVTRWPAFDDVTLNIGSGYDVTTGSFTAPQDGVYSLTYSRQIIKLCASAELICAQLTINGEDHVEMCGEGTHPASHTELVRLTAGDVVGVTPDIALHPGKSCGSEEAGRATQASFTGYLIT